jgi:hypothetical protein
VGYCFTVLRKEYSFNAFFTISSIVLYEACYWFVNNTVEHTSNASKKVTKDTKIPNKKGKAVPVAGCAGP